MTYRLATLNDCSTLARMNQQLILDERHRNRMTLAELEERMRGFLAGEYSAVIFEQEGDAAGYALFRREPDSSIYLRQFFVAPPHRRQRVGTAALSWLESNLWKDATPVRLEVLVNNREGIAFWKSAGFREYCITLERDPTIHNAGGDDRERCG